jgi:aspartate/glutamate racemase
MTLAMIAQTGPKLWGVLMLDTQFPRWKGDVGCPDGWPVELLYQKVNGMFPKEIVRSSDTLQQHDVLPFFVQAAEDLISQGVGGITTSCGFLILLQNELQSRLPVPVITSSLLLLPQLLADNATVGVLTMDELALGDAHFLAAGVLQKDLSRLRIQGVSPSEEFASAIMQNRLQMNFEAAQSSVVSAATLLQKNSPELQHVVLECTNMPPYAKAIEAATGWQLHSLHQLLKASSAEASK